MDSFLAPLLQIRLEILKLKLESRAFLTGAPRETLKPEEVIEIEREIKETKEQLKLMDLKNDF